MVRARGGEHELVLGHRVDQLLLVGASPVTNISPASRCRPERCASSRRIVGEPFAIPGDVLLEPVVEVELAGVAQLHDRDGGERLRDRADAVLRVGRSPRAACS